MKAIFAHGSLWLVGVVATAWLLLLTLGVVAKLKGWTILARICGFVFIANGFISLAILAEEWSIARLVEGAVQLSVGIFMWMQRVASPPSNSTTENQTPNKAPEPTPGAVTPRATEGTSK